MGGQGTSSSLCRADTSAKTSARQAILEPMLLQRATTSQKRTSRESSSTSSPHRLLIQVPPLELLLPKKTTTIQTRSSSYQSGRLVLSLSRHLPRSPPTSYTSMCLRSSIDCYDELRNKAYRVHQIVITPWRISLSCFRSCKSPFRTLHPWATPGMMRFIPSWHSRNS